MREIKDSVRINTETYKVIDSNYATNPDLEDYLIEKNSNLVILSDMFEFEAFKGSDYKYISRSYEVLARYHEQVRILKPFKDLLSADGEHNDLRTFCISEPLTTSFKEYCKIFSRCDSGDKESCNLVRQRQGEVNAVFNEMRQHDEPFRNSISIITSKFTTVELKIIRNKGEHTSQIAKKMISVTKEIISSLSVEFPMKESKNSNDQPLEYYRFRLALCFLFFIVEIISHGGSNSLNKERLLNHMIDIYIASYATIFDGFLSGDKCAVKTYEQATQILELFTDHAKRGVES